jgi:hypothetical protein
MSNATPHSHNPGDNKRRRSRGGQNRRNNSQQGNRGQAREGSYDRDNRDQSQHRNQNAPGPSAAPLRKYAPVRLSWWQKLLQLVGLYKAPTRPTPRTARQPDAERPAVESKVKSNTRNVRSGEGETDGPGERRDSERQRERSQERGGGRGSERSRGGDRSTVESPRVYVGNLSYDVSESDLQDLFKGIGGVRNVEIVYNRSTHRSKGYGFVEMLHMDEAKRAVEVLHDQPFMGRKLTVSGAQSKGMDDREDKDEQRDDRPERPERPERRPRVAPAVAAVAAATSAEVAPDVTLESLEASTEITTIIEPAVAAEAAVEIGEQVAEPVAAASEPASAATDTAADSAEESKAALV